MLKVGNMFGMMQIPLFLALKSDFTVGLCGLKINCQKSNDGVHLQG